MKSISKRKFILICITLAVIVIAGMWIRHSFFSTSTPQLMTATVSKGDIEETVLATGTLKPIKLVAVGAQVSGRILKLHVKLGQDIKQGDLIAEIDATTQENNLRTSQASLANTRAQRAEKVATLNLAKQVFARQEQMIKRNAIAQADFDTAKADVETTQAQIQALDAQIIEAQVAVDTATANVGYTKIKAPMDGTVLAIVNQEGQTVNAAQTAPTIIVLGQLDTMTIQADISEADVVRVKPGQQVYFTILGNPNHRFNASLDAIQPAPTSITSDSSISSTSSASSSSSSSSSTSSAIYYNGIFNVDNKDRQLRTYMTTEIHIIIGQAKDALIVPSAAVTKGRRGQPSTVNVIDQKGKVTTREVTIGLDNKINAEVKSGLAEGDTVVIGSAVAGSSGQQKRTNMPPMRL